MSQMSPWQKFSGFADTGESKQYIKVIVQGDLHLVSPDGTEFPPLGTRMVSGQHDDVLISVPDLGRWGWDRSRDPNNSLLFQLGISVPRSVSAPTTSDPVEEIKLKSLLLGIKLSEKVQIAPLHVRQVRVDLPPNRSLDDVWFTGQADTPTLSVPDGHIDNNQTLMILRKDTDEVLELEQGTEIGTIRVPGPGEALRMEGYSDLGAESTLTTPDLDDEPSSRLTTTSGHGEVHRDLPEEQDGLLYRDDGKTKPVRQRSSLSFFTRWAILILLLLSSGRDWKPDVPLPAGRQRSTTPNETPVYTDAHDLEYKAALMQRLGEQRNDRYAHLSDARFRALQHLLANFSDVLVFDGMLGGIGMRHEFDIELEPNAKPIRHQLPKMSITEMDTEQCHITKEEKLGHLCVPTDAQKAIGAPEHM